MTQQKHGKTLCESATARGMQNKARFEACTISQSRLQHSGENTNLHSALKLDKNQTNYTKRTEAVHAATFPKTEDGMSMAASDTAC